MNSVQPQGTALLTSASSGIADWDAFVAARLVMVLNLSKSKAAARYK